jgi:hypothetical protein
MPYHAAVHVRRQDYVGLQHIHGIPDIGYYREAIKYIKYHVGSDLKIIVFSDDQQWCRENFPMHYSFSSGLSKYDDMKLMAACNYHVIANSSFSWWGAWLGGQRMVVAPKQWFSDSNIDSSDIIPDRWIRL